ncbi:Oidioi.mRNA.OKI2018_I69.chr1.g141.t1.cds [Oikopleura dioica]|uniref:Oidioi.mRNA.OKI2018_I69.chr1.g141.t1.cds n=1 Tax=Oikopleura dioica TaxID=34765 RepID=A0ABN7SP14_OIKDI|nr:Oidioi.mRNA.OKI2018_I69.chr1.g141.t1.cds [Oikopleura dioica]
MESIKLKDEEEVTCIVCKSQGYLRQIKKACFLVPNDIGGLSSYDYQAKKGQPKNGFTTNRVTAKYLVTGTIFWVAVMVAANYITSAMNRFVPGHGSFCIKGFKRCSVEENFDWCASQLYYCFYEDFGNTTFQFQEAPTIHQEKVSRNIDRRNFTENEQVANKDQCLYYSSIEVKMCETLCDSEIAKVYDCYGICMALGASVKKEYCPFEKNCPHGCPCPYYQCETGLAITEPIFVEESEYYYDDQLGYWNSRKFYTFLLAFLDSNKTLSTKPYPLNFTEPGSASFCSETYKSQHYIFHGYSKIHFDENYTFLGETNHLEIIQIDEERGVVRKEIEDMKDRFEFGKERPSVCDSGKLNYEGAMVVKAFEDKHGTNLIVRKTATVSKSFSFFRLYEGHWIELVDDREFNCYEKNFFFDMDSHEQIDPILISGKLFILTPYSFTPMGGGAHYF